jgi:hypothetical protein
MFIQEIKGVQNPDAGCLINVHPCTHQITNAEGNQIYVLGFSFREFVILLLKLSCLNEEADESRQVFLHESYDEGVHLGCHHPSINVPLDETGDALCIPYAFSKELSLE